MLRNPWNAVAFHFEHKQLATKQTSQPEPRESVHHALINTQTHTQGRNVAHSISPKPLLMLKPNA